MLKAITAFITKLQQMPSATHSEIESGIMRQWRKPKWALQKKFDKDLGRLVPGSETKALSKSASLLLQISDQLGLTRDGVPDARPRNVGSPQHRDHPLVWQHYLRNLVHGGQGRPSRLPHSLVANTLGMVPERDIQAYLRLARSLAGWTQRVYGTVKTGHHETPHEPQQVPHPFDVRPNHRQHHSQLGPT